MLLPINTNNWCLSKQGFLTKVSRHVSNLDNSFLSAWKTFCSIVVLRCQVGNASEDFLLKSHYKNLWMQYHNYWESSTTDPQVLQQQHVEKASHWWNTLYKQNLHLLHDASFNNTSYRYCAYGIVGFCTRCMWQRSVAFVKYSPVLLNRSSYFAWVEG